MQNFNYGSLFLATMDTTTAILLVVIAAAICAVVGVLLGMVLKNKSFVKKQGDIQTKSPNLDNINFSIPCGITLKNTVI